VWGHFPDSIDDTDTLRILFANPKGIKLSSDILETEYSLGRCQSLGVGALCVAETNINWDKHHALSKFYGMLRKAWKHSKVSKSFTKDDFLSENQPGGTATMVYNKWTSRVIESEEDPFGLGRWSSLTIRGRGNIRILLVTAYRVCKQTVQSVGPKTPTAQQFRRLSEQFREAERTDDPIPRHQFIVDLQGWLEYKISKGYYVILGIDANEPFNPDGGNYTPVDYQLNQPISIKGHDGTLQTLVRTSGLVDPLLFHHPERPPPPTYDRGKDKIDFIFVSSGLLPYATRSGIFSYNSIFISDHRPCYIDLNSSALFQENTPVISSPQYCGLCVQDPRLVDQYTEELLVQLCYHKILPKAEKLHTKAQSGSWTPENIHEYEKLDNLITEAMLKAERRISKKVTTTYQLSPSLKAAINTITYWKLQLSQLKGKVISQHSLSKIFQHTKLSTALTRSLSLEEVVGYIREARATLKDIQKNHVELRSQHLKELANAIITFRRPALLEPGKEKEYEKKKQREIRRIMRREALIRVHKKIGYILKPNLTNGGLSRVDVPYHSTGAPYPLGLDPKSWNGPWVSLNSPKDIAEHVCAANTRQYHQAHCTPCGKEPLSSFLGYKANKPGALALIQGDPLPDEVRSCILHETESIFQTLQDLAR